MPDSISGVGIFSDGGITERGVTRGAVRRENPPVTALPCQPPLGKGAEETGERIATGALRPRNDRGVTRGACAAAHMGAALQGIIS